MWEELMTDVSFQDNNNECLPFGKLILLYIPGVT